MQNSDKRSTSSAPSTASERAARFEEAQKLPADAASLWKFSLDEMLMQIDACLENAKASRDFETVEALTDLRRDVIAAGISPTENFRGKLNQNRRASHNPE